MIEPLNIKKVIFKANFITQKNWNNLEATRNLPVNASYITIWPVVAILELVYNQTI